jgi:predicted amidophosphoribosyltransferase
MLSQCPHCKSRLQAGAKFCASCGKPTAGPAQKQFCTGCGAQLASGARFCGGCGQPAGSGG